MYENTSKVQIEIISEDKSRGILSVPSNVRIRAAFILYKYWGECIKTGNYSHGDSFSLIMKLEGEKSSKLWNST